MSTKPYLNAKDVRVKKTYYIGHRGSGKSALFTQLAYELKKDSKNVIIEIKPAEYSYETFENIRHGFHDVKSAFGIAWHYTLIHIILFEVFEHLSNKRLGKKNSENLELIKDFLSKVKNDNSSDGIGIFINSLEEIVDSQQNLDFSNKKSWHDNNKALDNLTSLYKMQNLKRALRSLNQILMSHKVFVFIDELDTGWNNSKQAKNYLAGLLYATDKVNRIDGVEIYLSLRYDMYSNLTSVFADTEKIRDDIEFLKWERSKLKSLMRKRIEENPEIKNFSKTSSLVTDKDVISLVFNDNVLDYIIDNTLLRPREVIYLSGLAIQEYNSNYLSKYFPSSKISKECVEAVLGDYSNHRLKDFSREYRHELPNLQFLLSCFEGYKKISTIYEFEEELEDAILDYIDEYGDLEPIKPYIERTRRLTRKLFDIGFVKFSLNNGNNCFGYYDHDLLNINRVTHVMINDMFSYALKCGN